MIKHYQIAQNAKANQVFDSFVSQYSIDPTGIYCLFTGKQIGMTDIDEFISLIDSFADPDPEGCADDLAMRLFASMRPSMRWNKMRSESLEDMRKSAPLETLSYLLNRLFMSQAGSGEGFVVEHGERIKTFQHISTHYNSSDEDFNSVMLMLLEIDSKLQLKSQTPPFICRDFLRDCKTISDLCSLLTPFYERLMTRWEQLQAEARYVASNPLSKSAYLHSFLESKPLSKSATAKAKKAVETQFWSNLFDAITGEGSAPNEILATAIDSQLQKTSEQTVHHSGKMPMKFGVKRD